MTCARCDDTGLIELTGGEHRTTGIRSRTVTIEQAHVTATPDRPIYKRCPCRDQRDAPVVQLVRRFGTEDD